MGGLWQTVVHAHHWGKDISSFVVSSPLCPRRKTLSFPLVTMSSNAATTAATTTNGTTSLSSSNSKPLTEVWTAEELMGHGGKAAARRGSSTNGKPSPSSSFRHPKGKQHVVEPADWGRPGHLTHDEVDVYVSMILCCAVLVCEGGIFVVAAGKK